MYYEHCKQLIFSVIINDVTKKASFLRNMLDCTKKIKKKLGMILSRLLRPLDDARAEVSKSWQIIKILFQKVPKS